MTACDPYTPWHPELLLELACATGGVYVGEAKNISLHESVRDVMKDINWVLWRRCDSIITSQHREKVCAARALERSFRLLPKADLELRVAALHSRIIKQGIPGQTLPWLHDMPESKAPTRAFCYSEKLCSWDQYGPIHVPTSDHRIESDKEWSSCVCSRCMI